MADVRVFYLLTLVLGFQAPLVILQVQAQASCMISADGLKADCQGRQLDRVPVDQLPSSVEVLDLSFNLLCIVNNADFFRLPNLRVLWLQFNNISLIEEEAFQRIVLLEELSIFNNSLTAIPSKALAPLNRLQKLDMSNNLYTEAALDEAFLNFSSLNMISIGGPFLSVLRKGDLDVLMNTSLDKFAIKTGSSLDIYEPGYLKDIQTSVLWLDIAVDNRTHALPFILSDLKNKAFQRLRFRNLFEFTYYTDKEDLFNGLEHVNVLHLVFYRGKFSEALMRMALVNVQRSSVKVLELCFVDFARSQPLANNDEESTVTDLQLDMLVLSDISNPDILRFDWRFTWLNDIQHLRIQNVNFNTVPCDAWEEMRGVRVLDVSKNRLQDRFLFNQQCVYKNKMPSLHTLNVSNNQLSSLNSFNSLAGGFEHLQTIDISHNQLGSKGNSHCRWDQNITTVIANHNSMVSESFKCLPVTAAYLDMSYCNLDQLDMDYFKKASGLTEVHLTGNKIKFIPSDWRSPNLKSLALDGNSFGIINTKSFRGMPNLQELRAGNNPYYCTCDLHTFIEETAVKGKVHITDWPENYKCYHPEDLLNTMVSHYFPGNIACDIRLIVIISVVTTAGVVLTLMLICYFCNIPWYAKATYQILRAKYRVHKEGLALSMDYTFHAFISYSHSDADWVRDQLLPCLENARPPYRLCIHERDFTPGKWIIDNIIDNIENSRKIIFVLSRHFVNSEWCNYELYFAQQRVMGKTFSDVILVVKEPIDPKSLPSKYCKLKKMLSTKTYLDWPEQPKHQAFFWAQLKSVLGKPSSTDELQAPPQRRLTSVSTVSVIELPHENQESVDVGTDLDEGTTF